MSKAPFEVLLNGEAKATAGKDLARAGVRVRGAFRRVPAYKPFPVEALPEPIREYVRQVARALGCDPVYPALPCLAVAASCIGNTRVVRLKRGWEEPSILWAAIVGDSGTLKSPAYLKAVSYLFRVQKRLRQEHKEACARYQDELQKHREAKARAKKGDGEDPGPPPEEPVLRRIIISDITIEKVAEILEDNPRGILLARDELAGWLGSFSRYKGKGGGSDLPLWLEAHRAGTWLVDRKTGERTHYFVPMANVSVAGSIQPGVAARYFTPEFLDAGGAARLLLAMPPKLRKEWTEIEVSEPAEAAYQSILDRLLELPFQVRHGDKLPYVLDLDHEAKAAWVGFYREWAREQAAAEGEMAAALSKLEAYAARLALIHHTVERVAHGEDDLTMLRAESIEAGAALCRWFADEIRRLYVTLTESAQERDARRLVEFIESRGGRVSARELQRSNSRKYPAAADAEAALDALVNGQLGAWEEGAPSPKGGHRTRWLVLNPTHDTSDTRPDDTDETSPEPSDTRADACEKTSAKHWKNEQVSEVSCVEHDTQPADEDEPPAGQVSGASVGQADDEADAQAEREAIAEEGQSGAGE